MSARPPEWLTVDQAAAELGLSPSGFRGLAEAEHLTIRRRGNQPGVARADVDAYLERARIHPGGITAGRRAREFVAGRKGSDFAAYEPYATGQQFAGDGLADPGEIVEAMPEPISG
jgi:excisionase family DNA binding protein